MVVMKDGRVGADLMMRCVIMYKVTTTYKMLGLLAIHIPQTDESCVNSVHDQRWWCGVWRVVVRVSKRGVVLACWPIKRFVIPTTTSNTRRRKRKGRNDHGMQGKEGRRGPFDLLLEYCE